MKKVVVFLLVIALLAGIGYFLWQYFLGDQPSVTTPPEKTPVETVTNKPTEQARTITDEDIQNWPDPGFTRDEEGEILTDEENFLKVLPTQN